MGVFGVRAGVQGVVERKQPAAGEHGREMRFEGRHRELDVGSRFVEEVAEDRPGDDVRGCGSAAADGGFDCGHAAVCFEVVDDVVAHGP